MRHDWLSSHLPLGLLWLSRLLYGAWLQERHAMNPQTLIPANLIKQCSKEPALYGLFSSK